MDHLKTLNQTAVNIKPSGIRKFFDILETMDDVISLTVGEPDFDTPKPALDAAIASLHDGQTHYTSNAGLLVLRKEISAYLARRFDQHYSAENELIVTVGGSEGVDVALRTIISPGDEVIIHEPNFVCYVPLIQLCGGVPVILETKAEDQFRITQEELLACLTPKTKAIILAYPNNPTGAVMERADLEALAEVLRGRDIYIISDEIYAEQIYSGETNASISTLPGMRDQTIVVSGFSKTFAMTGWRMGYVAAPQPVAEQILKIHQYAVMCPPTSGQYAALEALRSCRSYVDMMAAEYDRRRRFVTAELRDMGMPCFEPLGAFYVFPDIRRFGRSSEDFCTDLLQKQRVAIVPGTAFGDCGEGFVRISYAYAMENIQEAMRRIRMYTESFGK